MELAGICDMLRAMKRCHKRLACISGALLIGGAAPLLLAESGPNPYQAISGRNAFALVPPPPPQETTPLPPLVPQSKVILTGTTSMFGTPRALLEITETEAGKTATVRKPILREGERDGSIEVVSINMEQSLVRIRNAGLETNLSFEAPKLSAAAPPVAGYGASPPPLTVPPPGFSPPNAAAQHPGVAPSVPIFGNSVPAGGANSAVGARTGISGANGSGAGALTGAGSGGLRSIPSRSVRTGGSSPADTTRQYLNMAIQHEINTSAGQNSPPLPPVPGDPPVSIPSQ